MIDDPVERHTSELKPNQEDAEQVMLNLQRKGWSVYNERVPLAGQAGYYCVRTLTSLDGNVVKHAHSIRWNRFIEPLMPVTIDCLRRVTLLSFMWRHGGHHNFEYFEYGVGDFFHARLRILDDCFELGTLSSIFCYYLGAFHLAIHH